MIAVSRLPDARWTESGAQDKQFTLAMWKTQSKSWANCEEKKYIVSKKQPIQ